MAKVLQSRNRQKIKKGLTLVEVVVSLAIVSIVSIAVISLIITSTNQMRNTSIIRFFDHELAEISNLYMSYTYGDEESDYKKALHFYTGVDNSETYYYSASFRYVTSEESYSYYVTLDYHEDGEGKSNTLTLKAYYSDNKVILTREVAK